MDAVRLLNIAELATLLLLKFRAATVGVAPVDPFLVGGNPYIQT